VRRRWLLPFVCLFLALSSAWAAPDEDLGGTYLLAQRTTTVADLPVLPNISAQTRSVALLSLSQRGDRLHGAGTLCHIEIVSSSALVKTELPAALKKILWHVELDASLQPTRDGYRLRQSPRSVVLGAHLEDQAGDALPASARDGRVFDQDGDGHPGVTLRVRGIVAGELYVVQRATSLLDGTGRAGRFSGRVSFSSDDVVLGATRRLLTLRTRTRPDLARSSFWLERLPARSTCRDAMTSAAARWAE
jgi:hypothetical protein